MTNRGHMEPPKAAAERETKTPMAAAPLRLLARVARKTPTPDEARAIRTETHTTVAG